MLNEEYLELHNRILKLLKYIESENSKYNYDFDDISKKFFFKDIINQLHEMRRVVEKLQER
ncbi:MULTISPECIES: hypothetical protein [Aliarcobacter]|jgi:hypothetical protein|uniref:hypothetical protein n=1 Tax=Aliarcobacter TaxID=2321111 RepID=UPI00242B8205|nr:hypothetical protein [Aliarcobacter skirrowii]MDD2509263.1 hypothetical protein [Aliarcobacter skirrowii]MDD3496168.1 hypothetical protein [Aliarcobacter skirrowii]